MSAGFSKSILGMLLCLFMCAVTLNANAKTTVSKQPFGKMPDGTSVDVYTLSEGKIEARIITFGGTVISLKVPDKSGKVDDIVLGFDNLDQYVTVSNNKGNPFFGALIGRYANRIANATFKLEGKTYHVPANDGNNSLHGGPHGFNNVVWTGKQIPNGVELTYLSKDGEAGYPGNLSVTVRYTLSQSALHIDYSATTDKPTVLNLTNHSYFNLAGQGNGDVLNHELTLHASRFTPVNSTLIPTGELKPVKGTPFDFLKSTKIGERIDADDEQLHFGHGYDHNWVIDAQGPGKLTDTAEVYEPTTGRVLRVSTTQPGVQLYTGNFLDGTIKGKEGKTYNHRGAFCLETQHFPDSPNHPKFPTTELKPGQRFHSLTVFSFSAR
jgi:aldose 1-epimerase